MESLFLLRGYKVGGYGLKRIESEFIYSSLELAVSQINIIKLKKPSRTEKEDNLFRFEILEMEIDKACSGFYKKEWHFDSYGFPITENTILNPVKCKEKLNDTLFSIGTFLIPQKLVSWDFTHNDILPISLISRIINDNKMLYVLDYINDLGFLERDHFSKYELLTQYQIYNGKLPGKYSFLSVLSKHYRNEKFIEQSLLDQIYKGEVFLLDIPSYY